MIRWESGEAAHTLSSGFVTTGWENALGEAFRRLDLSPLGKFARVGYEAKSCGCLVESASGKGWLKLTGVPLGLRNVRREPEEAAQDLVGVPKPGLIAQQDWSDGDLCWRATGHGPGHCSHAHADPE